MKHEVIQTENYLLIVDDSEIKKGDWFYNNVLQECLKVIGVWEDNINSLNSNLETFKVITHLPLNGAPVLEGVKLLNGKALPTKQLTEVAEHYFIVGYETAHEKMFSEKEVLQLLHDLRGENPIEVGKWFEQFKKK